MRGSADEIKLRLQREMADRLGDDNRYLLSLYETMLGLINHLDMNELLTAIMHRAAEMVKTDHAFVYLVNPQEDIMEMILGLGAFRNFRFRVRRGEGMVGRVWNSGKPLMINDYCDWEGRVRHPMFDCVQAAIGVPLVLGGEEIGVIGLDYIEGNRSFDETQVAMLSRFAELASLVLENARAYTGIKQELVQREQELSRLQKMLAQAMGIARIGIFSSSMRQIVSLAQKYHENRDLPVLIEGETGTGKELVAKTIHFGNMENPAPFVDINCAAIPANLFESELFGYEAGAFTGALQRGQKGKFDLARGGTLFLDEIGEIPVELQAKLLRVIQEKEYFRVGGLQKIKSDVRIVCSTNVDLAERVAQGKFRKDLYYRLKVGHIFVPPLRERREEIVQLAAMFLQEFAAAKGKRFNGVSAGAERVLISYDWPGNVRELRNILEWVVALHDDGELRSEHLAVLRTLQADSGELRPTLQADDFVLPPGKFPLEEFIDRVIVKAVALHGGNKTAAADYLGISRRTVYYRLERLQKQTATM